MSQQRLTVVLDDDPTGTQMATDVTVLITWSEQAIVEVLRAERSVYVQTNSRAIDDAAALALAGDLRQAIRGAEETLSEPILVVLRGDSTLRGHVFTESDVFAGDEGRILFVPAFPQGGRTTIDSVHRVLIDDVDTPVGETEFARDPVFSFRSSNLVDWVAEKGARRAVPVSLDDLRDPSRPPGQALADALASAAPGEVVVPDVETDADVRLIHSGLDLALGRGTPVVVRSAATLAALCAGRLSAGFLPRPVGEASAPALVVCGSHTRAATEQLDRLVAHLGVEPVVVRTDDALADPESAGRHAADAGRRSLGTAGVAIVTSERDRRPTDDTLQHGELVMRALMVAARALADDARVVVSKGGITSAEVAATALGADRAHVRGQIAAGISVWDLEGPTGPATQVVVPGNVGGAETLVDVMAALGR